MGQQQTQPKLILIGFGGCSASGKSSVSKILSKELNSPFLPICGDHFFKKDIPHHDVWKFNYETPEAVDYETIKNGIKAIKEHYSKTPFEKFEKQLKPNSSRTIPTPLECHKKDTDSKYIFILIESFLLYFDQEICDLIDIHFFMICPHEVARERRMKRDHFCPEKWFDEMVWTNYEKYKDVQLSNSNAIEIDGTQPIEDSVIQVKKEIEKYLSKL
eukprot:gene6065-10073_t